MINISNVYDFGYEYKINGYSELYEMYIKLKGYLVYAFPDMRLALDFYLGMEPHDYFRR